MIQALLEVNGLQDTSANRSAMEKKLRTGGYKIVLALDTQIQTAVEQTLYNYSDYPALRDPADKVYRARNSDGTYDEIIQPQAAAAVIDYRTGELKAIVGSRTPPATRLTLNRATDMNMPVGSSIKPVAVFAPAIEMGAGPASVVYNMPLPIQGWTGSGGKDSWPQNYGGSSYRGPQTLRTSLVKSDNTATAQALMTYVGVERSADFLLRMGVSEKHINKTPFGLALGSSGLSAVEMASAFGVLGNGGIYQKPISFLGISDSNGTVIYDAHQRQARRQVFQPSTAWLTVDMMKEAVAKGTGTAAKISGQTVAGKTGTNSEQRGVFFTGMTGWYSAAVWIGHDNYRPLSSKTTGGNSAAKLWKSFMEPIHKQKGLDNRDILTGGPSDYGLVQATTCVVSGQLATEACRNDAMGYGVVTDYWPQGHPLARFLNTEYQGVLGDYLGRSLTGGEGLTCTMHNEYTQYPEQPQDSYYPETDPGYGQPSLAQDAQTLAMAASQQLSQISPDHPAFYELQSAISDLNAIVAADPYAANLIDAMIRLTQAMAAAQ